jgi:hypothetical protein
MYSGRPRRDCADRCSARRWALCLRRRRRDRKSIRRLAAALGGRGHSRGRRRGNRAGRQCRRRRGCCRHSSGRSGRCRSDRGCRLCGGGWRCSRGSNGYRLGRWRCIGRSRPSWRRGMMCGMRRRNHGCRGCRRCRSCGRSWQGGRAAGWRGRSGCNRHLRHGWQRRCRRHCQRHLRMNLRHRRRTRRSDRRGRWCGSDSRQDLRARPGWHLQPQDQRRRGIYAAILHRHTQRRPWWERVGQLYQDHLVGNRQLRQPVRCLPDNLGIHRLARLERQCREAGPRHRQRGGVGGKLLRRRFAQTDARHDHGAIMQHLR